MSKRSRPASGGKAPGRDFVVMALSCVVIALALHLLLQTPILGRLLARGATPPAGLDGLLLGWTEWGESLLLLAPSLAAGVLANALGVRRWAYALFLVGAISTTAFVALDAESYATFGRHFSEILRLALAPGGTHVVAGAGSWLGLVARYVALSALSVIGVAGAIDTLVRRFWGGRTLAFQVALTSLTAFGVAAAALLPLTISSSWRDRPLRERLFGALALDLRPPHAAESLPLFNDPNWKRLEAGVRRAYARAFPLLYAARAPLVVGQSASRRRPPDVVVFVVESLRADAFNSANFPRLSAWAANGLLARQHYAGSNSSESGMFALLYGRAPLGYHAALDAGEPPALCAVAHQLGYECAYFSGQPPTAPPRVEEFINARTFDHYFHDDVGDWPAWDRTAVQGVTTYLARTDRKPVFAVVYLMASHFPYEYPTAYARHEPGVPFDEGVTFLQVPASAYAGYRNRYLNSLAFTDDLLADAAQRVDAAHTVLALTGDHGESFGEDGRLGHGSGFSEPVSHVPFAMVGPGLPRRAVDSPTLHIDLLPTVVQLATGTSPTAHFQGQSLLTAGPARESLLFSRCAINRDEAAALFASHGLRIRLSLDLHGPNVRFNGLENSAGEHTPLPPLSPSTADEIVSAFEAELDIERR